MRVARFLVQGVDVWLNNPRRPLEASGTSGMKAAQNGVPNVSVLDGWWDEGYEGDNGWAIGSRETDPDEAAQDWRDAQDLYRHPRGARSSRPTTSATRTACRRAGSRSCAGPWPAALWRFSSTRMLHEYTESLYLPARCAAGTWRPRPQGAMNARRCAAAAASAEEPPLDTTARRSAPTPADRARDGTAHLAGARDPQPPAGRQLRLGDGRGLRPRLRADGRGARATSRTSGSRSTTPARCSTGCAPNGPNSSTACRRSSRAARSRSSVVATTNRSSPRSRSVTGSARRGGWARSSRRCSGVGRSVPGWPNASGSRTSRRRWSRPATTGRSSTTPTSAPRRSPRRTCGGRTRPRTRASSCASSGPSRACAIGSRSGTSRRSSTISATTPPRTASRVGMMGDDGEKFGAWPTTWEHCWGERRWVDRFFEALEANADWLTTTTPTAWLAGHAPIGRVYVPTGSYAEMGEWALPPDESVAFATALHRRRGRGIAPRRAGCAARSGATSRSATARSTTCTSRCCGRRMRSRR